MTSDDARELRQMISALDTKVSELAVDVAVVAKALSLRPPPGPTSNEVVMSKARLATIISVISAVATGVIEALRGVVGP